MLLLNTISKAQEKIVRNTRLQRLELQLTQHGLAERSNVPLSTLRKFEQKGVISLESFLKLQMVLGGLESFINSIKLNQTSFTSIDEVLQADKKVTRKRGNRK